MYTRSTARIVPSRSLFGLLASASLAMALPAAAFAQSAPMAAPTPASAQLVVFSRVGGDFVLTLSGTATNLVQVRRDGRDVLLAFAQAAPAFDASDLQIRAAGWLDGVNVGHDAVLLRLSTGADVKIDDSTPGTLVLRFSQTAARDERSTALPGSGALRLDLLRARSLLQEGDLSAALERFEALRVTMPRSVEPVAGLAATESQVGRWRRSLALYREAIEIDPADPGLQRAARAVEQAQGSAVRIDAERRRSKGGEEAAPVTLDLASLEASLRWSEPLKFGIDVDTAAVDTAAVQRADGTTERFSGRRERAALFARHDALDGTAHTLSLFAGPGTGGLGLARSQVDAGGETRFGVEFHRAYWEQVEAIVERAYRDRLSAARFQRLGRLLSGSAEIGLNRYGIPDESSAATSVSVAGELRWADIGLLSGLAAVYRLDAEYVGAQAQRNRAGGGTYTLLPLLDREVHSVSADYSGVAGTPLGNGSLSWGAQLGVGADRFGRSGPIAAASLTWTHAAVLAQLRAGHVRNIGRSRGTTTGVAASVSVPF